MDEPQKRLEALEQRVDQLQARLRALEERAAPVHANDADTASSSVDLAALLQQGRSLSAQEDTLQGELLYAGVLDVAHKRLQLQRRKKLTRVLEASAEPLAQLFAALSSAHRIIVLRLLCEGPRSSQSLQEALGMSSPGQLYHHLKELLAAGLIVQRGRRDYEIAPSHQVLICLALAIASDLVADNQGEDEAPPDQDISEQER